MLGVERRNQRVDHRVAQKRPRRIVNQHVMRGMFGECGKPGGDGFGTRRTTNDGGKEAARYLLFVVRCSLLDTKQTRRPCGIFLTELWTLDSRHSFYHRCIMLRMLGMDDHLQRRNGRVRDQRAHGICQHRHPRDPLILLGQITTGAATGTGGDNQGGNAWVVGHSAGIGQLHAPRKGNDGCRLGGSARVVCATDA